MGDPLQLVGPLEVDRNEVMGMLEGMLEGIPEAHRTFAEKYGNRYLMGSPATLLEAAQIDPAVRGEHGDRVMVNALVRVVGDLAERVEELEEAVAKRSSKAKA